MRKTVVPVAVTLALAGTLAACTTDKPSSAFSPLAHPTLSATASPTPALAHHAFHDLFRVGPWQLRVTGVDRDVTDTTLGQPENVDKIRVAYLNVSTTAAEFTPAGANGPGTLGIVYATDAAGTQYVLRNVWAQGTVNHGVSATNEFVFEVGKGTALTALVIGGTDQVDLK